MDMQLEFTTINDLPLGIGECPVWDHRTSKLWFIDITRPAIFRYDPETGALDEFATPSAVGSIGLAGRTDLVVALRKQIALFRPSSGSWSNIAELEPGLCSNRSNDGAVGPDGAFWVGTMFEHRPYQPTAGFYRIDQAGNTRTVATGLHVSNGLAWSPDGLTMYHADSVIPAINRYDFDPASGRESSPRPWVTFDPSLGRPDGAAVDCDGCYWSAGVSAGRLNRFSKGGTLLASIELPVRFPTMPCFGGHDLRTMFITSLSRDGDLGKLIAATSPVAGNLANVFGRQRL